MVLAFGGIPGPLLWSIRDRGMYLELGISVSWGTVFMSFSISGYCLLASSPSLLATSHSHIWETVLGLGELLGSEKLTANLESWLTANWSARFVGVNPGNNSSTADITALMEMCLYKDSSSAMEEKVTLYSGADPRAQPCRLILLRHPALNRLPGTWLTATSGRG